jgi:hypothetical protein
VNGGVNAPITPIRGTEQPLVASGWNRRIPGLAGLTDTLTMPLALVLPETLEPLLIVPSRLALRRKRSASERPSNQGCRRPLFSR